MNLIIFLIKRRIKAYFSAYNWKSFLYDGLLCFCLLSYGLGVGILYNYSFAINKNFYFSSSSILDGIKICILVLPIFLKFFPLLSLKTPIISHQYPVKKIQVATIDLIAINFYKTNNLFIFFALLVFCSIANHLNIQEILSLFLYWIAGFLLCENIVNAISWRKYIYLIVVSALLLLTYFVILSSYNYQLKNASIIFPLIINFISLTVYFLFYDNKIENLKDFYVTGNKHKNRTNLFSKILLRTKTFRTVIGIGILFKLICLTLFLSNEDKSLSVIFNKVPFLILIISPVILFTYVFNNAWGYFQNMEINILITNGSLTKQMKTFFSLLIPILIIDFMITFFSLFYFNLFEWKIVLFYFVLCLFFIPLSIISSFSKYSFVPSALNFTQFRGKTSYLFSFIMIIPVITCGFIYSKNFYFYISLSILVISSVFCYIYIKINYEFLLHKLKLKLLNY